MTSHGHKKLVGSSQTNDEITPTPPSPSPSKSKIKSKRRIVKKGPVSTSTKQITGYTTVKGILNETGCREYEYPEFPEKELMENAYDFFQDIYPVENGNNKDTRKIAVRVKIESLPAAASPQPQPQSEQESTEAITHIIRIAVRNSNVDNIPAFENLEAIFDYDNWYSTKRNQFRVTTGALGDFLKRGLAMGYALWTADFNPENSFENKQWKEPTIFRFNGQERRVFIDVEPGQKVQPIFDTPTIYDTSGFTEVEIALPIAPFWNHGYGHDGLLIKLKDYCRTTRLSKIKTDISFTVIQQQEKSK